MFLVWYGEETIAFIDLNKRDIQVQSNLNSSNIDGSFTMANSIFFFGPYEILPIVQEYKYLGNFLYFIMKLYVVCTH